MTSKEQAQQLWAVETRYRRLLSRMAAAVIELAPDGTVLFVNDTVANITGYTPEELQGQTWWEPLFPGKQRSQLDELGRHLQSGDVNHYELILTAKDGSPVILELNSANYYDAEGNLERILVFGLNVTRRKQTNEALRESEERFRTIFEEGPLAMSLVSLDFRFVKVNARLCQMLGYTEAELLQRTFVDISHPEDLSEDLELARQLLRGEIPYYYLEKRYFTRQGKIIWVTLTISTIRDEEGSPLYYLGMIEDITERKQIEADLARSQAFLQSIYVATGVAIYVIDVEDDGDFHYTGANPAWERMSGRSVETIRNKRLEELEPPLAPEALARARDNYRHCVTSGQAVEYEQTGIVHGQEEWWLVRLEPLRNAHGNVYRIIGTAISITERKQAELQALQSRDFHLKLFDRFPTLVWRSNTDGLCDYFNQTWLDFTGRTLEQEWGYGWAEGVHEEDLELCLQIYQAAFATREPFEMEYRLRHHDGEYRWVIDHGQPYYDLDGKFAGFIGSCYDITERKQMEQYVLRTERLAAMGHMTAVLAHEIKNPLQGLLNHVELLLHYPIDAAEREEFLRLSYIELERLAEISRRILSVANPEKMTYHAVYLPDLVQRTLELVEKSLQQGQIQLTTEISTDFPLLSVAPDQIVQVLLNLLLNAIEATPRNGWVHIEAKTVAGLIQVNVNNSGSPIPTPDLERIFDPFFTTKAGGNGLGLSISHSIVAQYGGRLTVKNLDGDKGVSFTMTLPVEQLTSKEQEVLSDE